MLTTRLRYPALPSNWLYSDSVQWLSAVAPAVQRLSSNWKVAGSNYYPEQMRIAQNPRHKAVIQSPTLPYLPRWPVRSSRRRCRFPWRTLGPPRWGPRRWRGRCRSSRRTLRHGKETHQLKWTDITVSLLGFRMCSNNNNMIWNCIYSFIEIKITIKDCPRIFKGFSYQPNIVLSTPNLRLINLSISQPQPCWIHREKILILDRK